MGCEAAQCFSLSANQVTFPADFKTDAKSTVRTGSMLTLDIVSSQKASDRIEENIFII